MTPDPARSSGGPGNPQSWNRYAYTAGDPVNRLDPTGLEYEDVCSADGNYCGSGGDLQGINQGWGCNSVYVMTALDRVQMPSPCDFTPVFFARPQQPTQSTGSSCASTETAWLSAYLTKRGSPLASFAASIVALSDSDNVDDRFIVALSGAESTYGKNTSATWGQYNAWSDSTHCAILSGDCQTVNPFTSWSQAISAAVGNITGKNYFGANPSLTTTDAIYERYSNGGSPSILNTIYLNQMGGGLIPSNPKEVDFARCTN